MLVSHYTSQGMEMQTGHSTIVSCSTWRGPSVFMDDPTIFFFDNIAIVKPGEDEYLVTQTTSHVIVMDMRPGSEQHGLGLRRYVCSQKRCSTKHSCFHYMDRCMHA